MPLARTAPSVSIVRIPPPAPIARRSIQRLEIWNMETGERLLPMTLVELMRSLSPRVIRALNALPGPMQRRLLDLPLLAQEALIGLPEGFQLQIIDGLSRHGQLQIANHGGQQQDALILAGHGAGHGAGVSHGGIPGVGAQARMAADLLDLLMGRGHVPDWMRGGVRVPMRQRAAAPQLMLQGPMPGPMPGMGPGRMPVFGPVRFHFGPGAVVPVFRPPALPVVRADLNRFPNRQEQLFAEIEARGRPAYRSRADVVWLANHMPGLDAMELLTLLRLPAPRTLANMRTLCVNKPAYRSVAFMANLAAVNAGVSISNLCFMAAVPATRTADIAALIAGRPPIISFRDLAAMATALPARNVADIVALAVLVNLRNLLDACTIGGAGAHRSGADLVILARRLAARTPGEVVLLANIPARLLNSVEELGLGVTPVRTAAILAALATTVGAAIGTDWILLLADLPGCLLLPAAQARAICNALSRHEYLLQTAANAQAALATAQIAHNSVRLRDIIDARVGWIWTLPHLMTVLNWAHYADYANMLAIVRHAKINTLARLLSLLNNATVLSGNQLYALLQNPKIQDSTDIMYLLENGLNPRYTLAQANSWIQFNWATRSGVGPKTVVNGRVPTARIPGVGGTASQRYSPDLNSGAWPGHVYHLSMSFAIDGPGRVRFTGFHVSWRLHGAADQPGDPRRWFTVNNGQVAEANASGAYPVGATPLATANLAANMRAEAGAMMRSYLVRLNCWM